MPLVARASTTVRNKNILIILLCAAFAGWFAYDGYVGWPAANDRLVNYMRDAMIPDGRVSPDFKPDLDAWKGWTNETPAGQAKMDALVNSVKNRTKVEGWKSPADIRLQRWIVLLLIGVTGGSVWWFFHCQKRRALADDTTVSPAPGVVVPWDQITRVDNTRWKSTGIVEITFPGPDGREKRAKFDDYELEREPLLAILDQLAEKATRAEFIPKEETAPESQPTAETRP
jgi:hypothetical protein